MERGVGSKKQEVEFELHAPGSLHHARVAVGEGFEPPVQFPTRRFSRPVP